MSALRNLYRKPSKTTFAVAGVSAVATVAVASGVAVAAPDSPAAPSHPVLTEERASVASSADPASETNARARLAMIELHKKAADARRAAARRAARRRAAARRAAELAAQQADRQAAQRSSAGSAGASTAPTGSPQQIALGMLGSFGWSSGQFGCLQSLWTAESGWNPSASNPSSGAYGIPQALPGSKMASAGPDWQSNPATQIRWGLGYIQQVYGSPCAAWSHQQGTGWY